MEFLNFNSLTKQLSLASATIPVPKHNEVLIKVAYCGVCGTDLHILEGAFPVKEDKSLILGHEFVGTIIGLGSNVKDFKIGQRVAVDPNHGCDKCSDCHRGCYHFCESGRVKYTLGIFRNGGWATHAVVPDTQIHLIPDDVDMLQAALTEPISCIVHGWDLISPINVGSKVLIIGTGIIGLLWACIFHLHGLKNSVTFSITRIERLKRIKKLDLNYEACCEEELAGKKFDFIIDCSGSASAMESALSLLDNGGTLCVFGVANPQSTIKLNPFEVFMRELKIIGVKVNPWSFPKSLALIQAMGKQYLDHEKLGIRVCKLSEYKDALEALRNRTITKVIFKCS